MNTRRGATHERKNLDCVIKEKGEERMSCLFDSLSCFTPFQSYELRQHICDYLLTDPMMYEGTMKTSESVRWEFGVSLPRYVREMRQHHTWGGAHEIKAFSDMFGCKVVVHLIDGRNSSRHLESLPARQKTNKVVNITWNGSHFTPVGFTTG